MFIWPRPSTIEGMNAMPSLVEVLLEQQGAVARVTINRPDQRNALSGQTLMDLLAAFDWIRSEPSTRVCILTGSGNRSFCAGANLTEMGEADSPLAQHQHRSLFVDLFYQMTTVGKPIVGRINGHALAGGLGLAASCDLLISVDTATFATPEINVGVWPMMIQAILARNLPRKALLEMFMLGQRWDAATMLRLGFVNRVVTAAELDQVVDQIASEISRKSSAVLKLGRDAFYAGQDMEFLQALRHFQTTFSLVNQTEDASEGIRAFFEKREPEFKGR